METLFKNKCYCILHEVNKSSFTAKKSCPPSHWFSNDNRIACLRPRPFQPYGPNRAMFAVPQVLDLSTNGIDTLPPLAAALPSLAELILDGNALRTLGDELARSSKLKKLSVKSNRIGARDPVTGGQVREGGRGEKRTDQTDPLLQPRITKLSREKMRETHKA